MTNLFFFSPLSKQYQSLRPVDSPTGNACFLPRDEGTCETWMVRFSYDNGTGKCKEFWYGGCHGNANNFISLEACQRACGSVEREPAPMRVTPSRGSFGSIARTRAHRARLQYTVQTAHAPHYPNHTRPADKFVDRWLDLSKPPYVPNTMIEFSSMMIP